MPGYSRRTCNVVEKLAHLTVSPNRDSHIAGKAPNLNLRPAREPSQLVTQPPALKSGIWQGRTALLGRPNDIPAARCYHARKVAG